MPYWSVEQWRAHIGSYWDVIGKKSNKVVHFVIKRSATFDHQTKWNYSKLLQCLFMGWCCFQETIHAATTDHQIAIRLSYSVLSSLRRFKSVCCGNQVEQSLKPCLTLLPKAAMVIIILRSGDVESNPGPSIKSM